jgi:hypothetical protein
MTVSAIVVWSVWAAFVFFLATVYIFRWALTRNEEDQIFLDESFDQEKAQQAVIAARADKIEPLARIARWLVAAMTVVVIVYYVRDVLLQLHIMQ